MTVLLVRCLLALAAIASVAAAASPGADAAAQTAARKKLLFLTYPGVAYHQSLDPAEQAVIDLGKAGGFDVTIDPNRPRSLQGADRIDVSFITPEYLAQFDGLMLMTNGNPPFTEAQKASFVEFVRGGKALIGAHCATVTFGKGRVFYTALGHRPDIWTNDPVFRAHIRGGIRWALGLE